MVKRHQDDQLQATSPRYPSLYQINTRVWLTELSHGMGRAATLDDIPDQELDRLADLGFDWIWLLSVWQTGLASREISRRNPEWRREFEETLPDLDDQDIPGSGFAITGYTVHNTLGGDDALARLRDRMRSRGIKLMLDFVPNHMGLDHPWHEEHPDYFILGSEIDLADSPQNYTRLHCKDGDLVFAYGRDPYFSGWPDTLQLNYGNPATQQAMIGELARIAGQCDGLRCDMAMLVLPQVFERTWGRPTQPFWPNAINHVRNLSPNFCFMAEVYWDLEWTLQQQGFDYTYDKRLYDRLRNQQARPVREHFHAGLDFQDKLARFLENHDEPRVAATFRPETHEAAVVITFLSPGLRFFHQRQLNGHKKRISPHLGRGPSEPSDPTIEDLYTRLLGVLKQPAVRDGSWQILECDPAWPGNWTNDCFVSFSWELCDAPRLLIVVNYAPNQAQCRVRIPFADISDRCWRLRDSISSVTYERDGKELQSHGLYVDMEPWQAAIFEISDQASPKSR